MTAAKRSLAALLIATIALFVNTHATDAPPPSDEEVAASPSPAPLDVTAMQAEVSEAVKRARLIDMALAQKRVADEIKAKETAVAQTKQPSRSVNERRETIAYEATAYVAMCSSGCTGITKTGVDVRHTIYYEGYRVIAVDPRHIPLGSIVRVSLGNGTSFKAIAIDVGSAIKGFRVDLLVTTEPEAWEFGRQTVGIEILRRGSD